MGKDARPQGAHPSSCARHMNTDPDRRLVTFYSYKGGVGRSMALANVAWRLASHHALNVIVVDWDLEAPGLHHFFNLTGDDVGLTEYLLAWQGAAAAMRERPPDVTASLIGIKGSLAPQHGSLSVLTAGRLDNAYGGRLASIDWEEFYSTGGGAQAIETMRWQLGEAADIVLLDSRTGLTDLGGICTIQLPDAVFLMACPNEQSLDGVRRVAFTIAHASPEQRTGRPRPRVWLSISRVPVVEEGELTSRWFRKHEGWFSERVAEGLWRPEDHPEALRSFSIPHRAAYTFGESLVIKDARLDPLAQAYDRIAATLFSWCVLRSTRAGLSGAVQPDQESRGEEAIDFFPLHQRVEDAESRQDLVALSRGLYELGLAESRAGRYEQAAAHLETSAALDLARDDRAAQATALLAIGRVRAEQGRYDLALRQMEKALALFEGLGDSASEAACRFAIGSIRFEQGDSARALTHYEMALARARALWRGTATGEQVAPRPEVLLRSLAALHLERAREHGRSTDEAIADLEATIAYRIEDADLEAASSALEELAGVMESTDASKGVERLIESAELWRHSGRTDRYRRALRLARRMAEKHGLAEQVRAVDGLMASAT